MSQLDEDWNPNLYHSTDDYNCIIEYNEETFVDKTAWTIRSHFIVMPILFLCAIKVCYFPHHRKACSGWSRRDVVERLLPLFLGMEALSHGFSGLYHLTVSSASSQNMWESVGQMFGIFACVVFFLFTIMVVLSCPMQLSRLTQFIWRLGISGLWLAVIYAYLEDGSIFMGISLHMYIFVAICLLLLLAYGIRIFHTASGNGSAVCHFFFKALALLIMIVSTAYAYNVYRKCGSYSGYLECFIRCPLPGGLNHNSFYNFAKAFALVMWALAEDRNPSISLYQLTLGLRSDEATVISDFDKDDHDDDQPQRDVESNSNAEARDTPIPANIELRPTEDSEPTISDHQTSTIENGSADEPESEEVEKPVSLPSASKKTDDDDRDEEAR